jgi:nicotinate phosphoribosyltransferase
MAKVRVALDMTLPPAGAFESGPHVLRHAALFTDLYELTMAAAYVHAEVDPTATFSLFVRHLPPEREFLLAAGLADVLEYLRALRFTPEALRWLGSLGRFDPAFLERLAELGFTGEVRAMPEGTVLFAGEPILEVTAPLIEAQLVETAVINLIHAPTLIASKAVRAVLAARGRSLAEFGLRRTHGTDAGMKAARAAWIAGFDSTSNVLAGMFDGIPLSGTMAHSYVSAFDDELEAFRAYARAHPDSAVLLLDTYDTIAAAHKAVEVARELGAGGHRLAGVRLDSGDLDALSRAVRRVLDAGGATGVPIVASGGLDEHDVAQLVGAGAPIDAFGLGTRIDTSADAPSLDLVYKLVRVDGRDVLKLSAEKESWVGPKAVHRYIAADGRFERDRLAAADEPLPPGAVELLEPVMAAGNLLRPHPSLDAIRARAAAQVAALPDPVRRLDGAEPYPVEISSALRERQKAARAGR